jgi:hypothetical protein
VISIVDIVKHRVQQIEFEHDALHSYISRTIWERDEVRPNGGEAGRMQDEIKRLQSVALAIGDDPMAREMDIEATAGSYAGERPFGRAANLPSTRPRKPTDADMGPHNWGGGEARPKSAGKMRGRRRGWPSSQGYRAEN